MTRRRLIRRKWGGVMSDKYVSAIQYAKMKNLNPETVKDMCRKGELEYFMTEGGHYKIKIYDGNYISRNEYEKEKSERIRLEEKLKNVIRILEV